MKKVKRIIALVFAVAVLLQLTVISASAANGSISVSSSNLSIGDTLTVTVKSAKCFGFEGFLKFDSSILQYTSSSGNSSLFSGGTVKMIGYNNEASEIVMQYTVKFKCIAAGKSTLSLSGDIYDFDLNSKSVSASSSVTVKGAENLSNDATLKSLVGSYGDLSPAFSSSITSYSVTVPNNVTVYTINAVTNHSGAKTSYSGSKEMKVGVNTRKVTVTAEDGVTRKTYTIKITRKEGSTSSTNNTSSAGSVSNVSSNITSSVPENFDFFVGTVGYNILTEWTVDTKLPAGFSAMEFCNGEKRVAALKSVGETVLLYSADANGQQSFVIYNEKSQSFSEFRAIEYNDVSYILTDRSRTSAVPIGFSSTKSDLLGKSTEVWVDEDGRTLIYATDTNGEVGFYLYDSETGAVEKYLTAEVEKPSDVSSKEGWLDSYRNDSDALFKTVIIETVIIVILLAACIVFVCLYAAKCKKDKDNEQ